MPLTISAVGYFSVTLNDFSNMEAIKIYLTPKLFELNEVVVKAKSLAKKRKANLKLFKNEFLGITINSLKCKIMNENDITFDYNADDTLRVFASKPILIENNALGYRVTYYLDKFEYYKKTGTVYFYGNMIFNEDITQEEAQNGSYERRRKSAYLGSRTHFFRELWVNKLISTDFTIKSLSGKSLRYKKIVIEDDNGRKFLNYTEHLALEYNISRSYIIFLKNKVYFDENGYFDPSGIHWKGLMAEQRIADWLPYEYSIK